MPYAEIGASLNNSRFGLLLWGVVLFVVSNLVVFEILCFLPDVCWKLSLQLFQAGLVDLCLWGIELATSTSITGDVTTNPTT